jgi:hypothetical protein
MVEMKGLIELGWFGPMPDEEDGLHAIVCSPEETNALRAAVRFSDMRAMWAGSIGEPGETEGKRMYEQAKVELDETIRALPDDVKARLRGKPGASESTPWK